MKVIHPDHFDLNLLRVFEAVYQERHLTRAAAMLSLTPSAVSHAIRRLREQMNDRLFERQGHMMQPTAECERLAPRLLAQMGQLRELLSQCGQFDPSSTRQVFRIAVPEALEPLILPPLVARMRSAAPAATLAVTTVDRKGLAAELAGPMLDVAIDVARAINAPVNHAPLLADRFEVFAAASAAIGNPMTLETYLAAPHVQVSSRSPNMGLEDLALLNLGLRRIVTVRCLTYQGASHLVEGSDLLLTAPSRLARRLLPTASLLAFEPPFSMPPVSLHMYWHASKDDDRPNRWLRDIIRGLPEPA